MFKPSSRRRTNFQNAEDVETLWTELHRDMRCPRTLSQFQRDITMFVRDNVSEEAYEDLGGRRGTPIETVAKDVAGELLDGATVIFSGETPPGEDRAFVCGDINASAVWGVLFEFDEAQLPGLYTARYDQPENRFIFEELPAGFVEAILATRKTPEETAPEEAAPEDSEPSSEPDSEA